jgi:hypothetical protein
MSVEKIQHPQHYGGKDNPYEVIKVLAAWGLVESAYLWNAVKYIARAGKKNKDEYVTDLKKAIFYINAEISRSELNGPKA